MFFFNEVLIHPRCTYLRRDLDAAVWHPEKADKGEIDESQCTWGHFDAEAAFRYLIRRFSELREPEPEELPNVHIDQLSAGAVLDIQRRMREWLSP